MPASAVNIPVRNLIATLKIDRIILSLTSIVFDGSDVGSVAQGAAGFTGDPERKVAQLASKLWFFLDKR